MNKDNNGLIYHHQTELTLDSTHWEYGQIDNVLVSGPHQARLIRPSHTLIVYDSFHTPDGDNTIHGDIWFDQKRTPCKRVIGQVADVIPYGCDFDAVSYIDGTLKYTAISILPELIVSFPGGVTGLNIEPGANIRSPLIRQLCASLKTSTDELHATSLMLALLTETAQHQRILSVPALSHEPLSKNQREQLACYIEDNLGETITLQGLAQLTELSMFHFSRVFKQYFGLPPYQYVLHRRLERAYQLVISSSLSLTEISAQCGFSAPAQFSTHFRRQFGQSPSSLRP
ncbi:AraC family transcriptional regulator [Pseudomonas lundensis]|uniref:AraC family transcriptional regulator n=1 Tax=Serratia proteamaculans TaxID=28151 RepID=UPI00298294B1|nr:AraC family transcriptional regulator [Serratia proteamaculans]MDW5500182.1 AraC family transcriptional regulator [Serratia proteamaculans]MDW5505248.1 AraC family transcriptional regulator [Pseudomonas lundensis]